MDGTTLAVDGSRRPWLPSRGRFPGGATLALAFLLAPAAGAQTQGNSSKAERALVFLRESSCSRMADPKLQDGGVEVGYFLEPGARYQVMVEVLSAGSPVATVFQGTKAGSIQPQVHFWDGRDDLGQWVDPGDYTVQVQATAGRTRTLQYDLSVVRLGITEIEALSSNGSTNEWQMVYFRRPAAYNFYATPAIHEYLSVAETGEISDLDLDDGSPRPAPLPHQDTAVPVMEPKVGGGWRYENDSYNYPLCYERLSQPRFELTFGASGTSAAGAAVGCNYPVPQYQIRCLARDEAGDWTGSNDDIQPGGTAEFVGPALSGAVTRTERTVTWTWQCRPSAGGAWQDIPGRLETTHRFYTNWQAPVWASGDSGVQYSGPWVEVADYFYDWQQGLGIEPNGKRKVVETLMKGFFGQNGPILTAIEDVHYDCPSEGGDGGATHYYSFGASTIDLSRLLHQHDNGPFVNCSDVAGSTSAMMAMLGFPNVEMVRLGSMQLKAIWGIGTPDYTLDLWSGSHGFSYHHIITRQGGSKVSDSCMWLDEDGDPENLPGTPGFNHDRPWSEYNDLSSYNHVSRSYDPLPKLR